MYQSPFNLAGITSEAIDKKELQLARKKLLAELELSGRQSLLFHGKEYTRQHIITLFDELADEQQYQLHLAIFRNKPLLHFLETAEAPVDGSLVIDEPNVILTSGISAIAADAVLALIQKVLKGEADVLQYKAIAALVNELTPIEKDAAFQPAYRYYTLQSKTLERTVADEKLAHTIDLNEAINWATNDRILLINALNDDFSNLRYAIARDLNNLAVALEKNNKIPEAYATIQKAVDIETTPSLMELIRENLVIFRRKAQQEQAATGEMNVGADTSNGAAKRKRKLNFYLVFAIVLGLLISMSIWSKYYREASSGMTIGSSKEPAYKMDEAQQRNHTAYQKLKQALARSFYTGHSKSPVKDVLISIPCDSCSDGFGQVWSSLMVSSGNMPEDTDGVAQVLVSNNLATMDLFTLVNVDDRYFGSIYLKPGQTKAYRYKGQHQADFNFYIGNGWDSTAQISMIIPASTGSKEKAFNLKGGFLNVPVNSKDYLNPDFGVFARAEMEGKKPFHDTVVVGWDKEGAVEFRLGLDERDF